MKKLNHMTKQRYLIFLIILLLITRLVHAQDNAGDLVRKMAEQLASDLKKKANKATLPENCKIYVLPFRSSVGGVDTLRTKLGLKLATEFSHQLGQLCTNKDLDCKPNILSPTEEGKDLYELQLKHMSPPSDLQKESEFLKKLSLNAKPDYYFTAAYELDPGLENIRLVKPALIKDKLNPDNASFPELYLEAMGYSIKGACREELKKWNQPIVPPADAYIKLMQFQKGENSGGLRMSMINANTNTPLRQGEKLRLKKPYQLKIDLNTEAFLYAFYYESEDPLHKMYVIGPVDEKSNRLYSAGEVLLPGKDNIIEPSPPASRQALIKLVASPRMLPLSVTTTQEGYIVLNTKDALHFVSILENMNSDDIRTAKLLYEIE